MPTEWKTFPVYKYSMRYVDFFYARLIEAVLPLPGEERPGIVDYRNGPTKGQWRSATRNDGSMHRWWNKPSRVHAMIMKDNRVALFYYGKEGNRIEWSDLLDELHKEQNSAQGDIFDIVSHKNGWLINRSRKSGVWTGDRNRYTSDLDGMIKPLIQTGLADERTPIWLGNWAAGEGEYVGPAGKLIDRSAPKRLVLYHGTSSFRYENWISKEGLKPLPLEDRVWNKGGVEKKRPEHRADSVYLTASLPQAEYYAKKAVNIDRKRFNTDFRSSIINKRRGLESIIRTYTNYLNNPESMQHDLRYRRIQYALPADYMKDEVSKAQAELAGLEKYQNLAYGERIEPVILKIIVNPGQYKDLMADDDYLNGGDNRNPHDWQDSLSYFGQIALRGEIPPNRIQVMARGADAAQRSR